MSDLNDPTPPPLAVTPTDDEPPARVTIQTAALDPIYDVAIRTVTWGFRSGAALLAIGIIVSLVQREPLGTVAEPFDEVAPSVLNGEAAGIIDLAILWMVSTPVVTVVMMIVGFFRLGDRRYALFSLVALAVLGISIGLALRR